MRDGEETAVAEFVDAVFTEYVAPKELEARVGEGAAVIVAELDGRIVGVAEVRGATHIALLFVDGRMQRRGIARALVGAAVDTCRASRPDADAMTVHSAPEAVEAYRRLGFRPTDAEQLVNGIRFVPMALDL